jgi:hypothetical protein
MEDRYSNDFAIFGDPIVYPVKTTHLDTVIEEDEVESSVDSTEDTRPHSTLHQAGDSGLSRSIVDVEREANGLVRR